jgi:dephospho-CoA kinase
MWWVSVPGSVLSGVLVASLLAVARLAWHRARVPTALSRTVRRRSYLGAVYAASRRLAVYRLDVLAPRLMPAKGSGTIAGIQSAWERINERGEVRVLTLDFDDCLQAGAELLSRDIEVRIAHRGLNSESLTFHLFESANPADAQAIVNRHHRGADRPGRIKGIETTQPFRSHFEEEWCQARPLESVLAQKILPRSGEHLGPMATMQSLDQARKTLNLDAHSISKIVPHLAFRDNSRIIFIVGQPGTGKSHIRRRLAALLNSMRIECSSLTDYPYAYSDLLRTVLRMNQPPKSGYKAYDGGAFVARDEATLAPALRALESDVRNRMQSCEVTLVEFARADLLSALREFEAVRCRSQVIHVSAPAELRLARLTARVVPPEMTVINDAIRLDLSDNHLLPSPAEQSLYATEGIATLKASIHWRDRIFEIDNGVDGEGHIDSGLDRFIQAIVQPYRSPGVAWPAKEPATDELDSRQSGAFELPN